MKHGFLITALALLLVLCLSACGCKHEWAAATCVSPRTCTLCAETEGEVLPHEPGQWMITESDYVHAENHLVRKCIGCSAVMEEYTSSMDKFHNGIGFLLSAEEFAERLTVNMQQLQEGTGGYTSEIVNEDGKAQLNIHYTEFGYRETAAELTFGIGGDELDFERKDDRNKYLAVGGILDADHLTVLMPALLMTVDPLMDVPDAFSLSGDWISERSISCNGLQYGIVAGTEAAVWFLIQVEM